MTKHHLDVVKTAVVLFVKDEAHDILTWIVWHKLVGFDSFIICDDGSTDGTASFIEAASRHFDIRFYQRQFVDISFFYFRQEAFYKKVLKEHGDEFEWIAFFDSDEYLSINDGLSLVDFLATFPEADAIAVNWAAYGSGGNILTPRIPSIGAFTRHSLREEAICTHVKSIVRPHRVGSNWLNVHAFDVASYRNCDNEVFDWGYIPGVTRNPPTWNRAKLMHFQLRSMEQFVERCKRRPDVEADRSLFDSLDRNNLEDLRPLGKILKLIQYLHVITRGWVEARTFRVEKTQFHGDWAAFKLITAHGNEVGATMGRLTTAEPQDCRVLAILSASENKCILIADGPEPLYWSYFVAFAPITRQVVLRDVFNLKFLTALPREHGGDLRADRDKADLWEVFTAEPVELPLAESISALIDAFNECEPSRRLFVYNDLRSINDKYKAFFELALQTSDQNDLTRAARLARKGEVETRALA